jgi:MHS family alpha-ketoglutarate permease-like MFS transporter
LIGGQLLASLVVLAVQPLTAWGWRIPFLIGALCAIVALYLRMSLHETSSEKAVEGAGIAAQYIHASPQTFLLVLGYTAGGR